MKRESNFHFLKTVVEHSGVPLMAYTVDDEEVTLVNQSVKTLFGIPYFTKLGSLQRADPNSGGDHPVTENRR